MTMFMIETDSATNTATQVNSLAEQLDNIASNVEGYSTDASEFDFSGPKGVLASSIKACATKMKNTSNFIESVVSSHQSFQEGVKFETAAEKAAREAAEKANNKNNSNNNSYSGDSGYSGYRGGSSSSSGTPETVTPQETTPPETTPQLDPIKEVDITDKIESVSTKDFTKEEFTDASKKIFDKAEYDEDGYAKYEDMYIIVCATALGVVGDVIEITTKDGKTIKCIVGANDDSLNGEIQFAVNDKWKEDNENNITKDLKDNIEKAVNKTPGQPALGVYTKEYKTGDQKWTVVDTKTNLKDYEELIKGKISQNADKEKYSDKCLSFAETHAYTLYSGKTSDTADSASAYKHSGQFVSYKTDDKQEALNKIYTEISNGRPVVIQVNGNKAGTSRHFVTVVGFKDTVTDPSKLTEKDLLIIDSWDGKIERMDQTNSRFLTTGKDTHKNYSGYYLRVLKDGQPDKLLNQPQTDVSGNDNAVNQTIANNITTNNSNAASSIAAQTAQTAASTYTTNNSTISSGSALSQNTFSNTLSSMSTPSKQDIISKAQEIGLSEDYIKTVIGTTQNEGYVGDPYLNYGWSSAMINNPVSSETIYSWGGGNNFYSQANINNGYENASDEVLKSVYLALTNRNTNIVECDGMYSETPNQYNLLYSSPNYNCKIYEK